ncbi:MAG TPA: LysR family transcriptional regulator [Lacipirellulaceae bacterium]|nr:LysR family transcriptional regulator [Lacipirellulaceae bacterium]
MPIESIDLNLLALFNALEQERNVTLAANRVGLTQPAMSNALARLRQIFDDPLFVRTGRLMQPTPFAERLAEPIRQSCALIDRTLSMRNTFQPSTSTRTFTFYMSDIGEVVNLPIIMSRLQKLAPHITVRVASILQRHLQEAMASGEVDLALGLFPSLKTGFYEQRLYSEKFVCIARADHPQIGKMITQKQFSVIPHVVVQSAGHESAFDQIIKRQGIKRVIAVTVPHFVGLPITVGYSDFIATIPLRAARSFSHLAKIKFLKPPFKIPNYDIKQHWHERYHRDPMNRWMRGVVAELFLGDRGTSGRRSRRQLD